MPIETHISKNITKRAEQLIAFIAEVKNITSELVTALSAGNTQITFIIAKQNSLAQIKNSLQTWPYGSLTDLNVRNEIVRLWPGVYVDAADLQTQIGAINTAFASLTTEINSLLSAVRGSGQFYDSDPVTGLETVMTIASPDTDALLALATTIRNSIN